MKLMRKSIGTVSADTIAHMVSEETHLPVAVVSDVIDDLVTCEILMDSREQFLQFHLLTYNPPRYPAVITLSEIDELTQNKPDYIVKEPIAVYKDTSEIQLPIFGALWNRHSCRSFQNRPVELEKLFAVCKASYSGRMHPVASAGALFPLSVYFMNRIPSGQLPVGLYQYDPEREILLLLKQEYFMERIQYALNDAECVFDAPCIFFICADISRHMKKYANSGYRYVLLEAGHSLQNMTIAAVELGLGGVEYGGFYDEAVKQLFQMPQCVFPLACYALGYEAQKEEQAGICLKKEREKRIIEEIVRSQPFHMVLFSVSNEAFRLSGRQVIVARFKDMLGQAEFGTGIAPAYGMAYRKAVMEAYERYTLSCRYADQVACASELDGDYLEPGEYVPYSDSQIMEHGFARFCKEDRNQWLHGYDLNGGKIYVPADLCFDVSDGTGRLYHVANTSGCAANFDIKAAEQAALLELIERDAIMKNWFYRQIPNRLKEETLPDDVKWRLQKYKEKHIPLHILSFFCKYAYVVLVCSIDDAGPPYFVSGGAASYLSIEEAVKKAFDEWEASFVLGGTTEKAETIEPEAVSLPKDHGTLYRYTNYNHEINYLCHGREVDASEISASKFGNIQELCPIFVRYKSLIDGAYVVRAFSKELVPINFGFGMDFYEHVKVDKQRLKWNGFPHYFS
ncbi:MAG: SagB/ThcOx family dehydrogenase [Lachnospiraceae bacterium]|nr:SagB/ThcOx family dehydrogenase [Lachnospiraceae bacterium]